MTSRVATECEVAAHPPQVCAPGFVGRGGELAALSQAVADGPTVMLVEGEAGIGKTRLIQEFLSAQASLKNHVLVASCPPLRTPCTLGPIVDALRLVGDGVARLQLSPLAGALRPFFPEWTAHLPPPAEPMEDPTAARHRVFSALAELLDRLGVTMLVLEDLHWTDEATVEFLLFAACRQPRSISLLVTCRPEDVPDGSLLLRLSRLAAGSGGLRLLLGPLDVAQTASMVSSMLGAEPVSETFAKLLHAHAEGLPLAVEESVRLLCARADVIRRDGEWVRRRLEEIAVPPTFRDAVLERVSRLDSRVWPVLRAAAVLAEPAGGDVLAETAGLAIRDIQTGLCEGLSCGLLAEAESDGQGLVSFRHVLAARAVYEEIPAPLRREMHLRAGRALETTSPLPLAALARHFQEAGKADKWSRYAEQAADIALRAGDETTAATLLHDLVSNAGLPGRDVVRLIRKTPLLSLRGQSFVSDLLQSLRSILGEEPLAPEERAEARSQLARVLVSAGENEACVPELEAVISSLGDRPVEVVHAMLWIGWPDVTLWQAAVHRRWLDRAAAIVSDPSIPAAERLACEVRRASALLMMGEQAGWDMATGLPTDTAIPQESLPITAGWLNTGDAAMRWGRYEQATRRLSTALALAGRHGYPQVRDNALAVQAHLDWFTGAWDGLAERASALASLDDVHPLLHLEAVLVAGLLDAAAGAYRPAEQKFRLMLGEAARRGIVNFQPEPAAALARLALLAGRAEDALALSDDAMRIITRKGIWLWGTEIVPIRVQALAATGRPREAAALASQFARGLGGLDAPAPWAALAMCRAVVAEGRDEHDRAVNLFGRAAGAWERLPRPYDALLARECQARCLMAAGQPEQGVQLLSELRQRLITLGALGDADRVVSALRAHGIQVKKPQRGGWHAYGDQLSPRELEVARLVLSGRTNPQIAQILSRSPKTIAAQLNSAMRKLGVSSRTALAVAAVNDGMTPDDGPQESTDLRS